MTTDTPLLTIISGSHRQKSQSEKVARHIEELVSTKFADKIRAQVLTLAGNPIPLWEEESLGDEDSELRRAWDPASALLRASDGFIIITPEWAGIVPPALKNLLLLASNGELAHKPALIVSISSGIGGSYPIQELRSSGYKNSKICYIPEQIIIRNVNEMLNETGATPENRDKSTRDRLENAIEVQISYTRALKVVRDEIPDQLNAYPYGM